MKRRDFIKTSAAASALLGMNLMVSCNKPNSKLKVLVLGGTYFVGPAIVNAALENNHDVTLFNRGITNPTLFPNLKLTRGDRENGASAYQGLQNENWDVVIDVWPEKSKLVDDATRSLQGNSNHYIFISSVAVYNDFQEVGLNEDSAVVSLNPNKEEWAYYEEKVEAENLVRKRFPDNHTILRCGPIKGWRDPAMDLLYWCMKLSRDESIIAPGSGLDPLQFIDVRDVGRFTRLALENRYIGTYNCVGPGKNPLLWKDFLELTKAHLGSQTELVWANENFLAENNVASFSDLPLWAPLSEDRGFMQISNSKLSQTGFEFSGISSILDDCMKWHKNNLDQNLRFGTKENNLGLERTKELELINKLKG
ncbi:MAG: NAD-dependent epimerase/dehydratase family protein [Saprospiraceae bacterium]|nr:NAD-dependent epimerase/dehydratase family protein [Saprospiraceae bacterium]